MRASAEIETVQSIILMASLAEASIAAPKKGVVRRSRGSAITLEELLPEDLRRFPRAWPVLPEDDGRRCDRREREDFGSDCGEESDCKADI